jgi:hypothetical protein
MQEQPKRFMWRAMTSVLIALSFLILLVTGIILFVSPPGRVANWTNWTILGLRKQEWTGLHIWFSTLFLVVTVVHLAFNWRPLLAYFKDRITRRLGFRWEWAMACVICAGVYAGTRAQVPPFASLLAYNERVKESWEKPAERAPIPHAELLSLAELSQKAGLDLTNALNRLQNAGIQGMTSEILVKDLAETNKRSSQEIYQLLLNASGASSVRQGGNGGAGGGQGRKTLVEYCTEQKIPLNDALARLKAKGIIASETLTLREIAVNNGYSRPYEVLAIIQGN